MAIGNHPLRTTVANYRMAAESRMRVETTANIGLDRDGRKVSAPLSYPDVSTRAIRFYSRI